MRRKEARIAEAYSDHGSDRRHAVEVGGAMGILMLVRYLCGSRDAIQTIAGNRHAPWIGLLFVLSAGFAREYDGEDLLHEPWYVVIPVGASLVTSFLLFSLAYGIAAT